MLNSLAAIALPSPAPGGPPVAAAPESAPPPTAPAGVSGTPNPRLRLDGELGVVVIEFRSRTGEVSNSFPTPREMDAYRRSLQTAGQGAAGQGAAGQTGRDVLA